jgi:hypothetical protein
MTKRLHNCGLARVCDPARCAKVQRESSVLFDRQDKVIEECESTFAKSQWMNWVC